MRKFLVTILILLLIAGGFWFYKNRDNRKEIARDIKREVKQTVDSPKPKPHDPTIPKVVLYQVPFTPQAPNAEWSDPEYDAACEEATMLMANYWVKNLTDDIPKDVAKTELQNIIDFEKQYYATSLDTSAADTAKWAANYFNTSKIVFKKDITVEDIKKELASGNLVAAPMNGTMLDNPNFRAPGPQEHFILFIGYDDNKQEFTVNDPGTRKGKSYKYDYSTIDGALRDFPTGFHEPITATYKNMIVISK